MKVRKLAIALALVGSLGAEMAQAIGLGDVDLESHLNEPLRAEINLVNVGNLSTDQIAVNLAPQEDFARAGIHRAYDLSNLNFKVVRGKNGQLVVDVTTKQPVREPYMDFLVELVWPKGRLLREYTLLIDPPTYNEGTTAPVAAAPSATPVPQAPAQPSQSAAPAQTQVQAPSASAAPGPRTYGPTKGTDTLWQIAERFKPSRATTQQMMLAIQDQNPDAFLDHNINLMKKGVVLRLPTPSQVSSRSAHQAVRDVIAQNRSFKASRSPINATPAEKTASGGAGAPTKARQDQLRLSVAPNAKESKEGSHGGGIGGEGEGSVKDRLAMSEEQLDKAKRDNAELNSRLQDLQDQVKTLNRLLQLKNDQLSALQGEAQKREQTAPATTSAPATAPATAAPAPKAENQQSAAPESKPMGTPEQKPATSEQKPATPTEQPVTPKPAETAQAPKPVTPAPVKPAETPKPVAEKPAAHEAEPGFPANILDELKNNRLYQIGAGGVGVLLLLALWLLARRNAHREKTFYDQLRTADEEGGDNLDMPSFGAEAEEGESGEPAHGESEDPLSEADVYIAYGRLDQASHLLEDAISGEPSRSDLRLKLLEVYAESSNREAFDKQFRELEALDDPEVLASAEALRDRLQETEEMPSIDDLESELKTGGPQETSDFGALLDEEEAKQEGQPEAPEEAELGEEDTSEDLGIEWDLSEEEPTQVAESEASDELEEFEAPEKPAEASEYGGIDFDLGDLELPEKEEAAAPEESVVAPEETAEEEPLDFSLDTVEEEVGELEPLMTDDELAGLAGEITEPEESAAVSESETPPAEARAEEEPVALTPEEGFPAEGEPLDESFLEELDAEIEKVTGESPADEETSSAEALFAEEGIAEEEIAEEELPSLEEPAESEEDALDKLELDVSDDDLAVLEEAAGEEMDDFDLPELDEEVDFSEPGETLGEGDEEVLDIDLDEPEADLSKEAEELSDAEWDQLEESDFALTDEDLEAAGSASDEEVASLGGELAEPDDEDFDFLAGTDEAATKLDLARAYIEMGDSEGARDILEEVSIEGSDEQKKEAQDLLKNLK